MAPLRFHFVTITNKPADYRVMRDSMAAVGFDESTCRFTLLDNSAANLHDPYRTLARLPQDGDEPYYILCHQDLLFDGSTSYDRLSAAVAALDLADDGWAVAGDAGISAAGERLLHIDDPSGVYRVAGLPRRVVTLDENFLLVRRNRAVAPSPALSGFHFYGADLCLNAVLKGRTCYVIDFPLKHLSGGTDSSAFYEAYDAFVRNWSPRLWVGVFGTTVIDFRLSANPAIRLLLRMPALRSWLRRRGRGLIPRR